MHGAVGVDGQAHPDLRVQRLVDAAEGEAHLGQALVLDPLRGDRLDLHLHAAGHLGERPEARRWMPSLAAWLRAVRTSCQALPTKSSVGRSITASSATWRLCHPRARAWCEASEVTVNRHGTRPWAWTGRRSPRAGPSGRASSAATGSQRPDGDPGVHAVGDVAGAGPSVNHRFSGQVVIHASRFTVPCSRSRAAARSRCPSSAGATRLPVVRRARRREGLRKACRPTMSTPRPRRVADEVPAATRRPCSPM